MAEDGASARVLTMWTVYFYPPCIYAVRAFDVVSGLVEPVARPDAHVAFSLERARDFIPGGLYRLERSPDDAPSVVETWM